MSIECNYLSPIFGCINLFNCILFVTVTKVHIAKESEEENDE